MDDRLPQYSFEVKQYLVKAKTHPASPAPSTAPAIHYNIINIIYTYTIIYNNQNTKIPARDAPLLLQLELELQKKRLRRVTTRVGPRANPNA